MKGYAAYVPKPKKAKKPKSTFKLSGTENAKVFGGM